MGILHHAREASQKILHITKVKKSVFSAVENNVSIEA